MRETEIDMSGDDRQVVSLDSFSKLMELMIKQHFITNLNPDKFEEILNSDIFSQEEIDEVIFNLDDTEVIKRKYLISERNDLMDNLTDQHRGVLAEMLISLGFGGKVVTSVLKDKLNA